MRKHRRTLLLAALITLALAVALAWLTLRPREPVYHGKTLTEWLTRGSNGYIDDDAEQAIHHFGTNAIPTLLKMLRVHDSKLKLQLIALAEKPHFLKLHFIPASERNDTAAWAFSILGETASNAVPGLIQIIHDKVSLDSQFYGIDSLPHLGPAATGAVPELVRTFSDTNANGPVHAEVAWALAQLHPELVVPVLIKCLKGSDPRVRLGAALWLGELNAYAQPAVPALVDSLEDRDPIVRQAAKRTLGFIDPEAVANASVK